MKKLFTLILALAGYACTAGAWGDLYLICPQNSDWSNTSYTDEFKFTCVAENQYRATVPGSYVTSSRFDFRFRDKDSDKWQNISPESTENDDEITENTTYSTNWENSDVKCFYIAKNEDAKYVHIYCNWNTSTNKWDITCSIVTEQTIYNVAYIRSSSDTSWENVYVYAFLDGVTLTDTWPGTMLSLSDGVYKSTIAGAANSRVIFNNGSYGNGNQSWTLDVAADALYNYSSKVSDQTVAVSSYGMSTFSSAYPLDFTGVENITAYRITGVGENSTLTKEAVTKVPANTGLYIEGTASTNFSVPATATATALGTNLLVPGTGVSISQTDGTNTNFILTVNKKGGGTADTPRFYKVNSAGNTVDTGKAYLQIPTASAAREFFWFGDESTGIEAVAQQRTDGQAYNLAGQRVAQPTRGLYIVNGKKVILK